MEDGTAVYELLRKHRETTRFHAIGLGEDVSEKWLQSVGILTKGGFEVVKQAAVLSASLIAFLERVLTPNVTGIEVIWPGRDWLQAPKTTRTVYEGDMVFTYANYGDAEASGTVLFRYLNTANKRKEEVTLPLPAAVSGQTLSKLWAFHRLSDMESVPEATALSLKYQIPCAHTVFIGVSSLTTVAALPMLAPAPRRAISCMKGGRGGRGGGLLRRKCRKAPSPDRSRSRSPPQQISKHRACGPVSDCCVPRRKAENNSPAPAIGSLLWFIFAQSTAGYWPVSAVREGLKAVPIPAELSRFGTQAEDIWATLQVIYLLSTQFASDSQKTVLLVRKAKAWLASLSIRYEDFAAVLQ